MSYSLVTAYLFFFIIMDSSMQGLINNYELHLVNRLSLFLMPCMCLYLLKKDSTYS